MQIVDANGNVFGADTLQINGADGKPKTTGGGGGATWGTITGTLSSQLDLQSALNAKYDASNPAGYITSAALSSYLTTAAAASTYYPLTNPSSYITISALSGYLTSATAAATYYPLTNPSGYTSNTGTVTSVQLAAGTGISLSGTNPITASGTITVATSGVTINKQTVTDGVAVTGTTVSTFTSSVLIPANTVTTGDILYVKTRIRRTTALGTLTTRMYVNTSAAVGGSLIGTSAPAGASALYFQYTRTLAVKSAVSTETMAGNANINPDDNTALTIAVSTNNIDWTQNQYIIVAVQNGNTADVARSSFIHVQIHKA
jgi:hypothetical protein